MNQRVIHAGFLWINQSNNRLAALYQAADWRFDGARQSGPTDCDSRDPVWTWSVAKRVCQGAQTNSRDSRSRTR